ncbi:MAG: helicase SNF2 [Nitrospirae bacterium GWC2_56_14]|nr:MAG: helicase SNF2 [Nitrospirae bacterium GWC2_56_14]
MNKVNKQKKGASPNQELQAVIMPVGTVRLEWLETREPYDKSKILLEREIFRRFSENPDGAFLFLGFRDASVRLSPSLHFLRWFCGLFAAKLRHTPDLESIRHKVAVALSAEEREHALAAVPLMTGAEYLSSAVLDYLWQRLHDEFRSEIREYRGTVEEFIGQYSPDVHLAGRVFFHLIESRKDGHPFEFLATYTTPLNKKGRSHRHRLQHALSEYGKDSPQLNNLLTTVQRAAKESEFIAGMLESGALFHHLFWSAKEAYTFLQEIPLYEQSGVLCRIPDWWKGGSAKLQVSISIGDSRPSTVGMEALLSFDMGLLFEDTPVSLEEARRLLESSEGLALIRNRWVAVDPEKLRQTLDAYEKARMLADGEGLTFRDALRFQLNPGALLELTGKEAVVTVTSGEWLETVMAKMRHPELVGPVDMAPTFKAELRPYQEKGVSWLSFLHSLNFGMCLADDMGLGKTVQVLALLHLLKHRGEKGASLLVIPASLIANWASEILKFAPDITFYTAHPAGNDSKSVEPKEAHELDELDLVITTYSMVQKYEWLHAYDWKYVVLDEAQAIKNPNTKQTKAVKKLMSLNRIVMTGTPVENRLSDLWSLFDFINPGLLGSSKEFSKFVKNLSQDPEGYGRLRKVISPYILRRLKTDKTVISDLPEKVEMKTWSSLSRKQAVLYQKLVDDLRTTIESTEGIQRKGLILSSLMKFKQLCNHPAQYLGTGAYDESESGKFGRLREICETIHEKRERVLVFTQFREITEPLAVFLRGIFGKQGLVLHGGTPVGKRKDLVERFQGEDYVPSMVLSLKAGGVGLNLTAANHVIHFDRWWNPAVEDQATDRAFRIGQKKNVIVHKFITTGTIEEKIDVMIEGKMKLSKEVIQSGSEAWITEMSNEELMNMFTLTI